ncbi:MAG: YkvA family protein, partial [Bdellovibrionaceae bacterium]|nr:YkvA family protein [Pseudobdellovibrionaceae bacterium]
MAFTPPTLPPHIRAQAQSIMDFFKRLTQFVREVANDERIPPNDKRILIGLLALLVSPFDIIPDWI